MNNFKRPIVFILLVLFSILLALASVFFSYYTARLIYLNLTMTDAAAHRSGGMFIGAVAFPLAAIIFGLLSWLSGRTARNLNKR
jgi:divalent metal cation (Fe/Co/Zn/Cd) transporter